MVRAVLACVALLGCNRVLGLDETIEIDAAAPDADQSPDLDGDHIPDDVDPCISAPADLAADFDGDTLPNSVDPCPFDAAPALDSDHDGIPDVCDPFPADAGDDQRCVLVFRDPSFFHVFWQMPTGGWTLGMGHIVSVGDSELLAAESIETHDVTVYDVSGSIDHIAQTAQVQILVRTSETPSASDAGCQVDGGATSGRLLMLGDTPLAAGVAGSVFDRFRMRITIEPGKATNIRCEVHLLSSNVRATISGHVTLGPGVFGVTATGGPLTLDGVTVYHRTDAPPLSP